MSHIETGNTKLSLPVLVDIAHTLEVRTDDLLGENPPERQITLGELAATLEHCTTQQIRIVNEIAKATKVALEKYSDV